MASQLIAQLYSQTHWIADGSQTVYDFAFSGNDSSLTYLDRTHVKAYSQDESGSRYDYVFEDGDFLGDYQLSVVPAPPADQLFVIYRDTPKDKPLVDFADGAVVSEPSLDDMAKQSVFIAAEALDISGLNPDLGYKALKHILYAGASSLSVNDNGKAHYKTDSTQVTVGNTIPVEYLTTIINDSASDMAVVFSSCTGHLQGPDAADAITALVLPAYNTLGVTKVASGRMLISGYVTGIVL